MQSLWKLQFVYPLPSRKTGCITGEFNLTLSQNGRPSPLDELYEYAKNKGTITYQEVTRRSSGQYLFEADQLDKVLENLEESGRDRDGFRGNPAAPLQPWKCHPH